MNKCRTNLVGAYPVFNLFRTIFGGSHAAPRVRRAKPEPIAVDDLCQLLASHKQTSVWLTPTLQPHFSKLGGAPDTNEAIDWPKGYSDEPMAFVAQLDLADVRAAGGPEWLPATGALYFFTDTETINPGGRGRVIYAPSHTGSVQAVAPPDAQTFGERHVGMEAHPSYPSTDWINVTDRCRNFDDADDEAILALSPGKNDDGTDLRCGGYRAEVQDGHFAAQCELWARGEGGSFGKLLKDPVAFDALNAQAIQQWRLLLQIDNDETVGMTWYDAGRIYYFIREKDARAGDFSNVQFDIQFC